MRGPNTLFHKLWDGVFGTLWQAHTDFTEMAVGWLMIVWGLWTIFVCTALDTNGLTYLTSLTPGWLLGLIFLSLGCYQVIAVALFAFPHRRVATALSMTAWFFLAFGVILTSSTAVSIVFYAFFAFLCLWLNVRTRFRGL